jgi:hypothetical protein
MRQQLVNYLRFAGFSLAVLAVGIFTKLTPAAYALPVDPPEGDPQAAGSAAPKHQAAPQAEADRIDALEREVARLDAELVNLRKALSLMGPLPDHADLSLPVDTRPVEAESAANRDPLANIRQSDLYAPAPPLTGGSSLFYEAELGSFKSRQAAEADWRRISKVSRLTGLDPRYVTVGADTRLKVGPLPSEAAAKSLCVELSALAGACRPVVPVRAY